MRINRALMSLCAVLAVFGCGGGGGNDGDGPIQVYATTSNRHLLRFNLGSNVVDMDVAMTGLSQSQPISGLDFRASNGLLYLLEASGQLYTVNTTTGAATPVGEGNGNIPINACGFSFNDVTDRARWVLNNDFNIRLNPDTGEFIDGDILTDGIQPDTDIHPTSSIAAIAYTPPTNNLTTLYAVDLDDDMLVRIGGVGGSPSPTAGLRTDIGPLGVDVSGIISLDFAKDGTAVFTDNPDATSNNVYTINLSTGAATFVGDVITDLRIGQIAVKG